MATTDDSDDAIEIGVSHSSARLAAEARPEFVSSCDVDHRCLCFEK